MSQVKELLLKVIKDNKLNINKVSKLSKISKPSLQDYLRDKKDERYQNLGSINYCRLRDFLLKYGYNIDLKKENFSKLYGVGICDESGTENGKQTKCYETWKGMFRRCYCIEWQEKEPTYKGCNVCNEWIYFSNFKKWYSKNFYQIYDERMELDKDILHKGNKIYSPNNCVFVCKTINTLFTKSDGIRGKLPIGVKLSKSNKYISQYSYYDFDNKKKIKKGLGYFDTIEEAFFAYKKAKEENIKRVADYYKDKIPNKLYEALYKYEVEITD